MSSARSRRTARRAARKLREENAARVQSARQDRVDAWLAANPDIHGGYGPGFPKFTRKQRQILSRGWGGGRKQQYKHADAKHAKWEVRREAQRAAAQDVLAPLIEAAGMRLQRLDFLGSMVPMVGNGTVALPDGTPAAFSFRFRYDRAFLEVGSAHEEYPELIGDAVLVASRDDVTGNPYEGWMPTLKAAQLIGELFAQAHAPQGGERFGQRMANTLDLLTGSGGNVQLPTLIR